MATTTSIQKSYRTTSFLAYLSLGLLWLGTVSISIASSSDVHTAKFHLSAAQLRLIDLGFALPGLLIWLSILFAALRVWRYARVIDGSKESPGFRCLSYGIFALLASLIASSYLGSLQQLASQHTADPQAVKTTFVILTNYVSVVGALITYGLLLQGSRLLLRSLGKRLDVSKLLLPIILGFVALTVTYLWLIHNNPASQVSVSPGISPTFGLSYLLIVTTVALPLVAAWFMGVLALIGMYEYRTKTRGIVYKLLLKKLLIGMTVIIGVSILLQLLSQLYSLYANRDASTLLGIVGLIYLVLAYAFVLIAQGAQKLNNIETMIVE